MTPANYPNEYNDELKRVTREAIEEALFILLKTTPFDKISISNLTAKAGVSRSAWYSNYASMEDVFTAFIVRDLGGRIQAFNGETLEDLRGFMHDLFLHIYAEKNIYQTLFEKHLDGILLKIINQTFIGPDSLERKFWAGGLYNLISEWIVSDFNYSIDELTEICITFARPVF